MQLVRLTAFSVFLLLTVSLTGQVGAYGGPNITGDWSRSDGALRISVSPCGERLCAVNTWTRDPSSGDAVGDRIVMTLRPRAATALAGEAFDEKRRLTYAVNISVDQDAMKTEGCLMAGVVCRTMHWVRPH